MEGHAGLTPGDSRIKQTSTRAEPGPHLCGIVASLVTAVSLAPGSACGVEETCRDGPLRTAVSKRCGPGLEVWERVALGGKNSEVQSG